MLIYTLGGMLILAALAAALLLLFGSGSVGKPSAAVQNAQEQKTAAANPALRAVVRCTPGHSVLHRFDYGGIRSCKAAAALHPTSCAYACLGFGDCVSVCPRGAIVVEHGCAMVRPELCFGCGECAEVCPRHLLTLLPKDRLLQVTCASMADAEKVQEACEKGCTGCGLCVQTCGEGAIRMEGSLAVLDAEKCTGCGECVRICPRKAIQEPGQLPAVPEAAPVRESSMTYSVMDDTVMDDTMGTGDLRRISRWRKRHRKHR